MLLLSFVFPLLITAYVCSLLSAVNPYFESAVRGGTALIGRTFILSCEAFGYPPISYTWLHRGNKIDASWAGIYAVRAGQLLISPVRSNHSGTYVCSASNSITVVAAGPTRLEVIGKISLSYATSQEDSRHSNAANTLSSDDPHSVTIRLCIFRG